RTWTVAEVKIALGSAKGSPERGAKLFTELGCVQCHRMGKTGGAVGPDLTDVATRMAKQPSPREALLIELIEPSKVIDEKYRTHVLTLDSGRQLAGVIVSQTPEAVRIAANPAKPDEISEIPRTRIEEMRVTDVSMMPTGLLDALKQGEILDLLAS